MSQARFTWRTFCKAGGVADASFSIAIFASHLITEGYPFITIAHVGWSIRRSYGARARVGQQRFAREHQPGTQRVGTSARTRECQAPRFQRVRGW